MVRYIVKSEEDTRRLAEELASESKKGDVFALKGDLGAGKTFFSACFINYFAKKEGRVEENVVSPTFNLVKIYRTDNFDIYHFDLYRLKQAEELYELDLDSAFENVALIEWPELAMDLLPSNYIEVNISVQDDCRVFEINRHTD